MVFFRNVPSFSISKPVKKRGNMKVNVKWNKEKYTNVELDTSSDVATFKAVLFGIQAASWKRRRRCLLRST